MFRNVLKGIRREKSKKWRRFGGKDTSRWKKEGSVTSMMRAPKRIKG